MQALRSMAEGLPYGRNWVLPNAENCFTPDSRQTIPFAHLLQVMPIGIGPRARHHRAASASRQEDLLRKMANGVLDGRFDLLGFRQLCIGRPVDWHLEPTSGKRSPLVHWKQLDVPGTSRTGDKKVVWELNRHQHLLTLGRAFLQTGDERYAEALVEDIGTWIRDNPPAVGINWVSSLEIAFRCISWLWSISLARSSSKWPSLQLLEIERSLYAQGRHIESYLSTYFSPNTHLTGEALGLYYLGTCLPELECARRWRDLGRSILLQQLDAQVRPDGVYFEQSTWYQRYTVDFYTHFIVLAGRAGDTLPARVSERLAMLLDYLMWTTRPDGTSPYIGDDDGGTLFKLDACAHNDWRAALSNGAVMFGRGDYKHVAGRCAEETCWLFGPDADEKFEHISAKPPEIKSRAFVDGGFYAMRSGWATDSNYLLVDCGPHGVMNCGHAHADALSIEVAVLGTTVLNDPGTFTYTDSTEFRDLFRSTAMHNTLTIDDISSSVPAGPFKWKHVANCTRHCWHDHPGFTYFDGSHDGYGRMPDPAKHTRSLFFVNREYWFMLDRVDAEGDHHCAAHFHMAPGVDASLHHETGRLEARAGPIILDLVYPEAQGTWNMAEGLVSPCYGAKVTAPHGTYSVRTSGPAALLSVMFPRGSSEVAPEIRDLDPAQGKALVLATPRYRDLLIWSGSAVATEGVQSVDFEWIWMRRSPGDRHLERAVFLHGTSIASDDVELTTERPVEFIAISVQDGVCVIDVFPTVGIRLRPPINIDRIEINGRIHMVGTGETLNVMAHDMATLAIPRDQTDFCSHVRH
jgi:hypothetical protein